MNAPFRPRVYSMSKAEQALWEQPKPRVTFMPPERAESSAEVASRIFAYVTMLLVALTILIPGFLALANAAFQ